MDTELIQLAVQVGNAITGTFISILWLIHSLRKITVLEDRNRELIDRLIDRTRPPDIGIGD